MIIDLKYHVASLIAVFLALGIGILIGSAVLANNVNDVVVQQQKQIVDELNRSLEQIRKDNKSAQEELNAYKAFMDVSSEFEKRTLPLLISGKLAGKKIAVIETTDVGLTDEWINVLRASGAGITSITTVMEGFDMKNEQIRKNLATKLMLSDASEQAVVQEIAREVAVGLQTAQNMENLHYFEQAGLIKISGEYGVPVDSVIVAGGSQANLDRCINFDLPLMNYFVSKKTPVYGVEASDVQTSYMKSYQKLKVSTVDNVDMAPGQLSLVMAVYGKPGNYGIKKTSAQLLPAIP